MIKWVLRVYVGSTLFAMMILVAMAIANNWKIDTELESYPKSINDGRWQMQYLGDGMYMIRSFEGKHSKIIRCEDTR